MAQAYTRQSSFSDGDSITAALFNNEYNQLVNVFAYSSSSASSTGHRHDGTAGEGGNIFKIGDLDFLNKVEIDSTNNRIGFYTEVSSAAVEQLRIQDGALVPVTDSDIDLGTTSLRFKDTFTDSITTTGNVSVGGNLTVTGTTTFNGGTITMGDADTDNVVFGANVDSSIIPDDDNTHDLGSSSQQWRNLYVDGTAYVDSINLNESTITATATELNLLDGVTATTTELNYVDVTTAGTVEASKAVVADSNADVLFSDNDKLKFGTDAELIIYHSGTESRIDESGTGNLKINADNLEIFNSASSEAKAKFNTDGAVELYHDNSKKFETTSTGVTVSGGTSSTLLIDASTHDSSTANTAILNFGFGHSGSPDATGFIKLTENGTNSFNGTMTFGLPKSNGSGGSTTNTVLTIDQDGDTTFTGDVTLTGASADIVFDKSDNALEFATNAKAVFGGSLSISRIGNSSYIHETGSGDLYIKGSDIIFTDADNNQFIHLDDDGTGGTVRLKHEGSTKLSTTSTGVDVTGTLDASLQVLVGTNNSIFSENNLRFKSSGTAYIDHNTVDADIVFRTSDASALDTTALTLDGSDAGTAIFNHDIKLSDNGRVKFGNGGDMSIYHNATDTYIQNATGNLIIENTLDDKDIILKSDDGSGGTAAYITLDGSAVLTQFDKDTKHVDSVKATFGDSSDLQIFHDGSNSFIQDAGTGDFLVRASNNLYLQSYSGAENYLRAITDGAVELYHDNSKKFETASDGIDIKGVASTTFGLNIIDPSSSTHGAHFSFDDTNSKVLIGGVTSGTKNTAISIPRDTTQVDFGTHITLPDNGRIKLGQASDLQLYHDGTHSYVANGTNTLYLRTGTSVQIENSDGSEDLATFGVNGAVTLFHNNSAKLATTSTGVDVTGVILSANNNTDDTNKEGHFLARQYDSGTETEGFQILQYFANSSENRIDLGGASSAYNAATSINFYTAANTTTRTGTERLSITNSGIDVNGFGKFNSNTAEGVQIGGDSGGSTHIGNLLNSSGALTLQSAGTRNILIDTGGELKLDADGGNITLQDGGTAIGQFQLNDTNHLKLGSKVSDADIRFFGNDGGSTITALILDMSDAGTATFNNGVVVQGDLTVQGTTVTLNTATLDVEDKNITLNAGSGDTSGSANGAGITIQDAVDASNDATILWDASNAKFDFSHPVNISHGTPVLTLTDTSSSATTTITLNGVNTTIDSNGTDGDIIFKGNDGGSEITALTLDMSAGGSASFSHDIYLLDNNRVYFGSGSDMEILHEGSYGMINNTTGNLFIRNNADDSDIIFQTDDGSGGIATYITIDGSAHSTLFSKKARFSDNVKAAFGGSDDLEIYHDGSHSNIVDTGTGNLRIFGNSQIFFGRSVGGEAYATFNSDSSVNLYFDNAVKFQTTSTGVDVTGTVAGDVVSAHTTENTVANDDVIAFYDTSAGAIRKTAVSNLPGGSGGSSAADDITTGDAAVTIATSTGDITLDTPGDIILDADGGDIKFEDGGSHFFSITKSSTHALLHNPINNGDIQIKGIDDGSAITAITIDMSEGGSATFNKDIMLSDNSALRLGTGQDLALFHDGTDSTIRNTTGNLILDVAGDIILDADGGDFTFKDGGTTQFQLQNSSGDVQFVNNTQDKDIKFMGDDGGSTITALTLDMSEAGAASFNGVVTANAGVVVDNITIDGTTASISGSADFTIDSGGRIDLSADDNGEIRLFDGSSMYAQFKDDSDRLSIQALISDADILFVGNDGGSEITALTLDMSEAGAATFNNNVTAFSDERLKDNIETLEDGLAKVEQLRGVTYTRNDKENIGVIAQEVEKILPEIVLTADDEMGTKSVDYSRITAVLIESVKELSARVKELENK